MPTVSRGFVSATGSVFRVQMRAPGLAGEHPNSRNAALLRQGSQRRAFHTAQCFCDRVRHHRSSGPGVTELIFWEWDSRQFGYAECLTQFSRGATSFPAVGVLLFDVGVYRRERSRRTFGHQRRQERQLRAGNSRDDKLHRLWDQHHRHGEWHGRPGDLYHLAIDAGDLRSGSNDEPGGGGR